MFTIHAIWQNNFLLRLVTPFLLEPKDEIPASIQVFYQKRFAIEILANGNTFFN